MDTQIGASTQIIDKPFAQTQPGGKFHVVESHRTVPHQARGIPPDWGVTQK